MPALRDLTSRAKVVIMLAVMSGLFVVALDQTIVATALGAIVQDFKSYDSLGLVVTAYLLTLTISMPIAGKLSDLFGRRLLLIIGLSIFTIGSFGSGISGNITELIAWRAFQGIGGGIVMANAFTIIGDLFSARDRAKWQGFIGAVFGLSSVVGPLLGGYLTDPHNIFGLTTDWRWNFFINIPVGLFAITVIALKCPQLKQAGKKIIDYSGAILLVVTLASIVLAVDNTELIFGGLINAGMSLGLIRGLLFAVAALGIIGFIYAESKTKEPIVPLHFFRDRTFTAAMISLLFFGAAFLAVILYITQFNQQVFGASATQSGIMLLPLILAMSAMSGAAGQIIHRTGKYKAMILLGFFIATVGIFGLSFLTETSPYWLEAIFLVLAGLGFGVGMPVINLAVQNEFEDRFLGAATASSQLFRGLGSTVGTAVLSGLLTAGIATSLGNISQTPYVQSLQRVPEARQMIGGGDISTNTALQLNAQRDAIRQQAEAGIEKAELPPQLKQKQIEQFEKQANDYSQQVTHSFASSLQRVFQITTVLMLLALVASGLIRERKLT